MNRQLTQIILCFTIIFFALCILAKDIEIITFNDFHGALAEDKDPNGKNPGMAKMATFIKEQEISKSVIVVSGGDNFQGSALSGLTEGAPVIDIMNYMGVSVSVGGNHEFDWGTDKFCKWEKTAKFPFISANIIYS